MYRSATIFFGDIVNFTNLSALSTAREAFLNDVIRILDLIILAGKKL